MAMVCCEKHGAPVGRELHILQGLERWWSI